MSECFDVIDKNRKPLGYTKERGSTLLEHEYNIGVENYIISNHKLLMTKRSIHKSHAGQWEVPGGCSQSGESSYDTLRREMEEEVGIKVDKRNTKLIGTKLYKKQFVDIYQTKTRINIKNIHIQEEEVSEAKLISKEEFEELVSKDEIVPSVLERWNYIKDKLDLKW